MNLKLAVRNLFKNPFVTAVAILSLALGIGANAAVFSLFDQVLLRELPVTDPWNNRRNTGAGVRAGNDARCCNSRLQPVPGPA